MVRSACTFVPTAKVCSPHHLRSSPPLLASPADLYQPRPPPARAGLRLAKVCRPALSPLTPLAMCCVRMHIHSSELTMYYLDCSDFATLPPPQSFPSLPLPIDGEVLSPTHRCSSQSSPRSAALPIAALPGPVAAALHRRPTLPAAAKVRHPPHCRSSPPQPRSAALPVTVTATPRRHQGPPPSPSQPLPVAVHCRQGPPPSPSQSLPVAAAPYRRQGPPPSPSQPLPVAAHCSQGPPPSPSL